MSPVDAPPRRFQFRHAVSGLIVSAPAVVRSSSIDSPCVLGRVPTATVQVRYEAKEAVFFPTAPAGLWRGRFGAALHRAAQAGPGQEEESPYKTLFRTPRSAVDVPDRPGRILGPVGLGGEHVPHPFVLRITSSAQRTAPLRLAPGETTKWTLGLIGTGVSHVPVLAGTLDALGKDGIGRKAPQPEGSDRQGRMVLREATLQIGRVSIALYRGSSWRLPSTCDVTLYERAGALLEPEPLGADSSPSRRRAPELLPVRFKTPVRLTHNGTILKRPSALTAEALARACYRRWAALSLCYAPTPPTTEELDAAFDRARTLGRETAIAERALEPAERTRYSARQDQRLSRTGLRGTVRLAGPPARRAQWHRWIERLRPLHVGKSTSMGFGRIAIGE